jgi:tRNA A37 threonylcarbamoyladenosine modification protein TsaB
MILFLDIISPIPKFVITDNNNVIESLEIIDKNCTKISDIIHTKFINLQKKYNLLNTLNHLTVFTGPGSYTCLRVGISFMLGISYATKKPIYGITCTEFLSQFINNNDFHNTFIIICSSSNQNFICLPTNKTDTNNYQYKILKINDKHSFDTIDIKMYNKCIANFVLPDFINEEVSANIEKLEYINIEDKLFENFINISNNENILQPIYISDNKLFD